MSEHDINLRLDWRRGVVDIHGATLRDVGDFDELIRILKVLRATMPGGEEPQPIAAQAETARAPVSAEPVSDTTAPMPSRSDVTAPAKQVDEEPSEPEGSAGVHDRCESTPAPHPVANVGEEANGAEAAASAEPASRESDGADRQQPVVSGLAGEEGEGAHNPISPSPKSNGRPRSGDSLASRIRAYMTDHPDATKAECAEALGETWERIHNNGKGVVTFKAGRRARRAGVSVERRSPAPAPEQRPIPERPPVVRSVAVKAIRPEPITRVFKRPTGARFHLRDAEGRYLRFDCIAMTADKHHAWVGNAKQLFGCRAAFSIAADLIETPITTKEPAHAA